MAEPYMSIPPTDGVYRILATIHNVQNPPVELTQLPPATTVLACIRVAAASIDSEFSKPPNPVLALTFNPSEITERNGALVVSKPKSVEWALSLPKGRPNETRIELMVDIAERRPDTGNRTLSSKREQIDLQLILDRKMVTRVIGTSCGQIGVSFEVAPSDKAGFNTRLTRFMEQHNPKNVPMVAGVVEKVNEVAGFTRVFKRYNVVNYTNRVTRFFEMYGPDFLSQVETTLKDWNDREEEFLRSLVLDNGPEPADIPVRPRLAAYSESHGLDLDVDALLVEHQGAYDQLFAHLRSKHGPEPDPRSYLFPAVSYPTTGGAASSQPTSQQQPPQPANSAQPQPQQQQQQGRANATATSLPPPSARSSSIDSVPPTATANSQPPPPRPATQAWPPQQQQQQQQTPPYPQPQPPPPQPSGSTNTSTRASSAPDAQYTSQARPPLAASQQPPPAQQQAAPQSNNPTAPPQSSVVTSLSSAARVNDYASAAARSSSAVPAQTNEVWNLFCADLQRCHIPPAEVHYLHLDAFTALLEELRFPPGARSALIAEWQRRLQEALHVTYLAPGDQQFEAAKAEVVALSGLEPINVQVMGVVALRNTEHETGYSVRLAGAKVRAAERCLIVGDHGKLMDAAKYGVSAATLGSKALTVPRRPFASLERPTSIAVLICDCVIGKPYYADHRGPSGVNLNSDFAAEYDSIIAGSGTSSQTTTLFSPQQLLPRYLVHCSVDPTVSSCPAHPHKAVEYFVVEQRVFACSQCVVMGAHRGAAVITVDEAVAEARQRLTDVQRDTESIANEFTTAEADAHRALEELQSGRARREVVDSAEEIKRDAERRAAQMLADFDAEVSRRTTQATEARERIARSRAELLKASEGIGIALRSSNPSQVMRALSEAAPSIDIPAWRHHAEEAKHLASSCGAPSSASATGGGGLPSFYGSSSAAPPRDDSLAFRPPAPVRPRADLTPFSPIAGSRILRGDAYFSGVGGATPVSSSAPWASRAQAAASVAAASQMRETSHAAPGGASSLYEKFMHLKGAKFVAGASQLPGGHTNSSGPSGMDATSLHHSSQFGLTPNFASSSVAGASTPAPSMVTGNRRSTSNGTTTVPPHGSSLSDKEKKAAKEQMAQGWSSYRAGDKSTAHRLWADVFERFEHTAVGARARAYIYEAIERDIEQASVWYERALRHDPGDVMTLFNYGVMLEGANKKKEAVSLFETAGRLGDQTAARRAEALKRTL